MSLSRQDRTGPTSVPGPLRTPTPRVRGALRGERGETLPGLLIGMVIASIVLGGAMIFWLSGRDASDSVAESTKQESAGLVVLNRLTEDAGDAGRVVLAARNEVVLEESKVDDAGVEQVTRTRYVFEEPTGRVFTETTVGPASTFEDATTDWGATSDQKTLAEGVRLSADGVPFFEFQTGATVVAPTNLPMTAASGSGSINQIKVAYAAEAGRGDSGRLALRTTVHVATGASGQVDPTVPTCPVVRFVQGDPYPIVEWDQVAGATEFNIYRDDVLLSGAGLPVPYNEDLPSYTWSEDSATFDAVGTHSYRVTAVGAGGESEFCSALVWYPRVTAPDVTVQVVPGVAESPAWETSANSSYKGIDGSTVTFDWPQVTSPQPAQTYEIYARPINDGVTVPDGTARFAPEPGSAWALIATVPAGSVGPGPEHSYVVPFDKAFAYRVVSHGSLPEPSEPSRDYKTLVHADPVTSATATVQSRGTNLVTWVDDEVGPSAAEYAVYRRAQDNGCVTSVSGDWALVATVPLNQRTWVDSNAPASSSLEYMVGVKNVGPRGSVTSASTKYAVYGRTTAGVLQYPTNPVTDARGSLPGFADDHGTFRVAEPAYSDLTRNRVIVSPGPGGCASTTTSWRIEVYSGTAESGSDAGEPLRRLRTVTIPASQSEWTDASAYLGSRRFYRAVAINATGASPVSGTDARKCTSTTSAGTIDGSDNGTDASGCADPAYQAPNARGVYANATLNAVTTSWTAWARDVSPGGTCESRPYAVQGWVNGVWTTTQSGTEYRCQRYARTATLTWPRVADFEQGSRVQYCTDPVRNTGAGVVGNCVTRYSYQRTVNGTAQAAQWSGWVYGGGTSVNVSLYSASATQQNVDIRRATTGSALTTGRLQACNPGGCQYSDSPAPPPLPEPLAEPEFVVSGSEGFAPNGGLRAPKNAGQNMVAWKPVATAVSYQVLAYDEATDEGTTTAARVVGSVSAAGVRLASGQSSQSGVAARSAAASTASPDTCEGAPAGFTLCLIDTGRVTGTETWYRVVAVRGEERAGEFASAIAGYQVPDARTANVSPAVGADDARRLNLRVTRTATTDDPRVRLGWNQAADGNEPASDPDRLFCRDDNRGGCSYDLVYRLTSEASNANAWKNVAEYQPHLASDTGHFRPIAGVSVQYAMQTCNDGGCAVSNVITFNAPPCAPAFRQAGSTREMQLMTRTNDYGEVLTDNREQFASQALTWNYSEAEACTIGLASFRWGRAPVTSASTTSGARDPLNLRIPAGYQANDPATAATVSKTARTSGIHRATPGSAYTYQVWAVGQNGLMSALNSGPGTTSAVNVMTPPTYPLFMQSSRFCVNGRESWGWKQGLRVVAASTTANTYLPIDRLRSYWYAEGFTNHSWTVNPATGRAYTEQEWFAAMATRVRNHEASTARTSVSNPTTWFVDNQMGPYYGGMSSYGHQIADGDINVQTGTTWDTGLAGARDSDLAPYTILGPDTSAGRSVPWQRRAGAASPGGYVYGTGLRTTVFPGHYPTMTWGASSHWASGMPISLSRSQAIQWDDNPAPLAGQCNNWAGGTGPSVGGSWVVRSDQPGGRNQTSWLGNGAGGGRTYVPHTGSRYNLAFSQGDGWWVARR